MIETLQHLCQEQNRCQDKFKELLLNKLEVSKKLAFISSYPHDKHQAFLKMYNEILGDIGQTDLNWDELYFTINYLYNNFQQKLKDKFPSLNEKEIQLCCLIRGGFKTDEIAFVIRQSVYSIHNGYPEKIGYGRTGRYLNNNTLLTGQFIEEKAG